MFKSLVKPVTILFILAQLLAFVAPTPALAQEPVPEVKPPAAETTVLSAEKTSELAELAVQSEQYLDVRPDGTLALTLDDPSVLGVDQALLDAYRAGLDELNDLVRTGDVIIKDDLTVEWNNDLPVVEGPTTEGPADAEVEWGAYRYRSGVTIYFNPHEVSRLHRHGVSFASMIGAHLRRPRTVPHYNYLFTHRYNYNAFRHHRYSYGTYFFTPWQHFRSRYYYKSIYFYRYYGGGHGRWIRTRVYY